MTTQPRWPDLDPENGDFTDGWNQAIDLCKQAFGDWAVAAQGQKDQTDAKLREIDIKNLQFYAEMAEEHNWNTGILGKDVISQTLNVIAERLRVGGSPARSELESILNDPERKVEYGTAEYFLLQRLRSWASRNFSGGLAALPGSLPAQPEQEPEVLGDPLWPVYQRAMESKPKPLPTYSGWLRHLAILLERQMSGSLPSPAPPQVDWEELLFEYGDRHYASAENRLSDVGMVANAQRRKELHSILLSRLQSGPSLPSEETRTTAMEWIEQWVDKKLGKGNRPCGWPGFGSIELREVAEMLTAYAGAASPAEGPTPPTMEIEEAALEIIRTLRPADPGSWDANMPYVLARLKTLASGPKPGPRCPNGCTKEPRLGRVSGTHRLVVNCDECNGEWEPQRLPDFSRFFTPSAGEPQPHGKETK